MSTTDNPLPRPELRKLAPSQTIDLVQCETADEFLVAIGTRHPRWQPDPTKWVYRGQRDAKWDLVASAHRDDGAAYRAFGVGRDIGEREKDWTWYGDTEDALVERFQEALDRAGLPCPVHLPDTRRSGPKYQYAGEVHPNLVPLLALAQHVGLPTSLLDWTRQARFAAYFGAADTATRGPSHGVELAVWALREDFVNELDGRHVTNTALCLETAPAASNPNLHAQQGLFTRLRADGAHRLSVDAFVSRAAASLGTLITPPLLRKVTVPQWEAQKLLRLLAHEGVTGAQMFPGFAGVVRAMREKALWNRLEEQDE